MKYLSEEAISWAISELKATTHPFLGITFLACKEQRMPVGIPVHVRLDSWTNNHLHRYHRLDPSSAFLFQPLRSPKNWVNYNYASTGLQAVNTQTFGDVFLHQRGKPKWGFASDYIGRMKARLQQLSYKRVPLVAIAIWMFKDHEWGDEANVDQLISEFRRRFNIVSTEIRELFSEPKMLARDFALFQPTKPDLKAVAYRFEPPPDAEMPEGILTAIQMKQVGPADELRLELGERLTVIAGDNGLGKSFLLDVAWWAATEGWAGRPAMPFGRRAPQQALIEYELRTGAGTETCRSRFHTPSESWIRLNDYPKVPGLYVYARVDGAFSVADDLRDRVGVRTSDFSAGQVWEGKEHEMEGLVRDWVRWQLSGEEELSLLQEVLKCLSPSDLGVMKLVTPTRPFGDWRRVPVIRHPYGDVPILYASAGVRRILAIAYMVVWSWQEHLWASSRLGFKPVRRLVLLVDEIEAHLHPFWQRTILPAILRIGELLDSDVEMQTVVSTHSPLVLASLETRFRPSSDLLYHLRLGESTVVLESQEFAKYGDVSSWLTSPAVGLRYARSREAEAVIEHAKQIQLSRTPDRSEVKEVSLKLMKALPADDPFWRRWNYFAEQAGVEL